MSLLDKQTVVLIGGSSGIGLETTRLARAAADVAAVAAANLAPVRLNLIAAGLVDTANTALTGVTYDIDGGQQFVRA
ncbi:hypothetical protein [Cryptosporangium aurantiacum]|uniref:Short chain dehydrogenase n=1 Tax=Cryptosporangium aurantiacum TaxID=134849 RepID=A0A1M7Q7Y1_9ACTN|nr:hypothetical protein [Cryptosporangium aurantiacum]SHN26591.1 hypothetical protein SAMN05443668_104281 [Cryptosporangium aurantiacum]